MSEDKPLRERIALGECVSDRGVDHCPVCCDTCEASHWKHNLSDDLKELNMNRNTNDS